MQKNAAVVENGVVENVIVVDDESLPDIEGLVLVDGPCGPGWLYSAETDTFSPPEGEVFSTGEGG